MAIDFELTDDDEPLLKKLTRPHRDILLLSKELTDPSYKGIANHMGSPVGTVKSRLSRARHILIALRKEKQFNDEILAAARQAAESL